MSSENNVSITYSKNEEYWRDFEEKSRLETIEDFKKLANKVIDVCFISGRGVGFLVSTEYTTLYGMKSSSERRYQFNKLTPKLLEELAEGFFFDKAANAKMWYCCMRYAIENKDCVEFWHKYKDTSAGSKMMGIMLGSKTLD